MKILSYSCCSDKYSKHNHWFLPIFWLLPIITTTSTGRAKLHDLEWVIVYILGVLVGLGVMYTLLSLNKVPLSKSVLIVACAIFFYMLVSDITEFKLVAVLAAYSIVVHAIAKKYPLELWKQYYLFCLLLSWLTIIEIVGYFIMGSYLFSFRVPEIIGGFMPRVTPIFDEMSHQAFFIMPAAISAYGNNNKHFFLLFGGVLLPFSVAAIVMFLPLLIYFNESFKKMTIKNVALAVVSLLAFLIVFSIDFIVYKFSHFIDPEMLLGYHKTTSASNLVMAVDILKWINIDNLLLGIGYFGDKFELREALTNSALYDYYLSVGLLELPRSVGIINFITDFGLVLTFVIGFILYLSRQYAADKVLYSISMFIVIASMLKNNHTVDYFVHLFFVFGLAWGNRDLIRS